MANEDCNNDSQRSCTVGQTDSRDRAAGLVRTQREARGHCRRRTTLPCRDAALYADEGNPRALASGIVRLADDFELRRSMGLLGRQRVEQALAWKYSEKPYLSMYYDVLGISMPEEVRERLAEVGSTPEPVAMAAR